ncbi:putative DNA-invertase from lambdoid prophage Rac [termite gut metagenome]|uniref:Putative DNA-invertase from lambdoid prophage Rac n=1 Tax=termite gut metagenome TaxID=433724 RepID=A0A5J4RML1_9ZZZZ
MTIAYIRVSTEKQHLENQKEEILRYASKHELSIDKWYTEVVSGCVSTKGRKLSRLLKGAKPGDTLIITEISRLSRTLLDIMIILNFCIQNNITLYSIKEGYIFQNNINSKVLGFAFGLVAEIERNLISMRTKEALARRKQEGVQLGRKPGNSIQTRVLRENKDAILEQLDCILREDIARKYGTSRSTLYRFLKKEAVQPESEN